MKWSRDELDRHIQDLEARVPALLQHRDAFFRAFEDEVEVILGSASPQDQDYAEAQLEAIVERSGVND
jgi:hypothetical protein